MSRLIFVDSEINAKKQIVDLGAVTEDGANFHKNSVSEFTDFIKSADFIVGHNIFRHDLIYIDSYLPNRCEIIDTLFLSPLLFPSKPYHKLVKDDKIQTDDVNNPLSDSIKCKALYYDEEAKFNSLEKTLRDIYGELLSKKKEFSGFFHSVSWRHAFFANPEKMIRGYFKDSICNHANLEELIRGFPIELAYALALITAEDKKSITPGWVLHAYPNIQHVFQVLRSKPCHDPNCHYCSSTFGAKKKLKEYFGYDSFRTFEGENLQEKAVEKALDGKSLLVIFPTGGGKSLTFQLPALINGEATRSLTVVISPLQSLMKDQVDNLEKKNIVAGVTLNGQLDPIERAANIELVRNGTASLLYIAPESLRSKTILKLLLERDIARVVIDEAHCFSSWGQDFRVDYLFIARFIKDLQAKKELKEPIPISCFTATAKPKVISDISSYFRDNLGADLEVLASRASRTNLHYKVLYQEDREAKYQTLRDLLNSKKCPTIVYVSRVRTTTELADRLNQDGIPAVPFNGQMEKTEKVENQNLFMENKVQVIVATTAFGMGVDKSDVKLVVHYNISDSLENYVQEAGRAGRDQSLQAECYILFNNSDLDKHFLLLNQTKITINEIQQVWRAIKSMTSKTRKTFSASGLEIARQAGWDENIQDIETRVRTALSALEQSGYIIRKMNSPHVFATGIRVKTYIEAADRIDKSGQFINDEEKTVAKRVIKYLIGANSRIDDDGESRIDYIADSLGIPKIDVIESVEKMRQEKILADSLDLYGYIKKGEENKTTNIIRRFAQLERYMLEHIFEQEGPIDLKELNDKAIREGIKDATVKNIKTILYYWALKELIRYERCDNVYRIMRKKEIQAIKERCNKKLLLAERASDYLFSLVKSPEKSEELVRFSLLTLTEALDKKVSLLDEDCKFDEENVKDALLYLSKIGAIRLDGGFLVIYNSLNVERIITDNHIQYKVDDYKDLANYYKMKVQQIHMVGEFANMMLRSYDDALTYVKDYFNLEYDVFLRKYFKGRQRTGEIMRNITPEKYQKLFGDLSPIQRKIIDDDKSQFISVIAGPGSGKTRVLVHKLASLLLLEDIKSEQLLMLTFSRAAAREFKNRLRELIGEAVNYVDIKTFHSYCFDLLGKIGNEEEFDDVVKTATQRIADGEVEESQIAKAVLVIDEAQDMDEDEYNLITALIQRNPEIKIIAVGDDDQNIYEFRGSDSKYLNSLIDDFMAQKYEMTENYRSRQSIVAYANRYARTIKSRIKTNDIVSMSAMKGNVFITRYTCEDLEVPVCRDLQRRNLTGTTAVLTITNESALKVVGILNKEGVKVKFVQSDDELNLYNLSEFRFFLRAVSKSQSPIITDEEWEAAKNALRKYASSSALLPSVMMVIEAFEKENPKKYKNDFITFVSESSFSDFDSMEESQIVVSTIHKAKGREFDNVFLLLDGLLFGKDEEKRKVYVGMTRAKNNLFIHTRSEPPRYLSLKLGVQDNQDPEEYFEPEEMEIQLGYHDINLGYSKYFKDWVLTHRAGDCLDIEGDILLSKGRKTGKFSKAFYEKTLLPILEKGYSIYRCEIRYIVAWKDKEHPEEGEIAVILPNIYLRKIGKTGNKEAK